MKQTKFDLVKQHLLAGNSISSLEAMQPQFKCAMRLSAIIYTLKHRDNIEIESCTEESPDGARYSRYWVNKRFLEQMNRVDQQ